MVSIMSIFAAISYNVYAENYSFECGTDPELTQELNNALIQKKFNKQNNENSIWNEQITLFQTPITIYNKPEPLMPSTGDVKMLKLPFDFMV